MPNYMYSNDLFCALFEVDAKTPYRVKCILLIHLQFSWQVAILLYNPKHVVNDFQDFLQLSDSRVKKERTDKWCGSFKRIFL